MCDGSGLSNQVESKEPLSFEAGILSLEKIVKLLEQKDLSLEKALAVFKEGVGLVQYCSNILEQAEKQMEILLEDQEGKLKIKPASLEVEG